MGEVTAFVPSANLVDSVRSDPSAQRNAWLAALPSVAGEFAGRWALELEPPYQPGGRCAWVAPARDRALRDLVLKVAWRHDEAMHEADGLRACAGDGVALLYDGAVSGSASILLLQRCRPGTTLGEALPEPDQDRVVARLLRRLWQAQTGGYGFRPLQVMCDAWVSEFKQRLANTPGLWDWPAPGPVPHAAGHRGTAGAAVH